MSALSLAVLAFTHVLRVGTTTEGTVYVTVKFSADGRLSITGSEGPRHGGQINMALHAEDIVPAEDWDAGMIAQLWEYWDAWHLNDMQAGTPAQQAHLDTLTYPGYTKERSHYEWACEELRKVGLNPDGGYKYGSAWLRIEVPEEVILWLKALPVATNVPSWA